MNFFAKFFILKSPHCSSVDRPVERKSVWKVQYDATRLYSTRRDVGSIPGAAGQEDGKIVEKNIPSHAICETKRRTKCEQKVIHFWIVE